MNDSGIEARPAGAGPVGVLVLGMHRSGTSALAGVLNMLGATTPGELMPPTEANERGYFEKWNVVRFNDDVLARLGSAWDDPLPLGDGWIEGGVGRASLTELEALIEAEFANTPFFSLKDPRISRLLPLWLRAMAATGRRVVAAIPLRHPLEVVGSVVKRDGLPRAQVLLSWLDHMIEAERGSRALPRACLLYADLLADWRGEMERLRARLGLFWSTDLFRVEGQIDAFLGADLRHHRSDEASLRRDDPLEGACAEAWDALQLLRDDPDSADAMAALDGVRERIARNVAVLGPVVVSLREGVAAAGALRETLSLRESEIAGRDEAIARRDEEIRQQIALREEEARAAQDEFGRRDAAIREQMRLREEEARAAQAEFRRRDDAILQQIALREEEARAAQDEAAHRDAELARQHAAIREQMWLREEDAAAVQVELARRERDFTEVSRQVAERDARAGALLAEMGSLREELAGVWAARQQAERDLRKMRASTSWQVTRPLRRALEKAPWLASASRRTLRGSWWAMSGQLPRRLKERRASLAATEAKRAAAIAAQAAPAVEGPAPAATETATAAPLAMAPGLKEATRALLRQRLAAFLESGARMRLPQAASGSEPDVSIVIVLFNQAELTFGCLASIVECLGGSSLGIEVILLDNGSTDETARLLDRLDGARIVRSRENLHFLRGVNRAADEATGRHLLLLNNDAQLTAGSLEVAAQTLDADPGIGAVGGRIVLPDGTLQEAGSIIWRNGACQGYARGRPVDVPEVMFRRDVDYCSGAFLLTPRDTFDRLGRFDPIYAPAYYEETDYCVRLWEDGLRVVFDPRVLTLHFEFGSSGKTEDALALQARNFETFRKRHALWLVDQPAMTSDARTAARSGRRRPRRVLYMEDRLPKPELGAGYPRAKDIIAELDRQGAAVTLFPMFAYPESWHDVRATLPAGVEFITDGLSERLGAFLAERAGDFDAIFISRPHNMKELRRVFREAPELRGSMKIIYDAEAVFARRELLKVEILGEAAQSSAADQSIDKEMNLARGVDAVVSVSNAERRLFEANGLTNVRLLGHMMEPEPTTASFEARRTILFLGAMHDDASPNADSLRWFASKVLPPLRTLLGFDIRLTVVGFSQAPSIAALDGADFDLIGQVDDLRPYFEAARVIVVPTRFAAGIPHKAHQAASFGVPMVTTELIAEQLGWTAGEELLVGCDPGRFAAACHELYTNPELWERLRARALDRVTTDCAPDVFRTSVSALLDLIPQEGGEAGPSDFSNSNYVGRAAESDFALAVPFGYRPDEEGHDRLRTAGIFHIFHDDLADEILSYAVNLPQGCDLYISTDTEQKRARIAGIFRDYKRGEVTVRTFANRGRDIAPKLVGFRDVYSRYDVVLHLHSKRSHHDAMLAPWRTLLFENLVGSPGVVASVLDLFRSESSVGMVLGQHYEYIRTWLDWRGDFDKAAAFAKRLGITLSPHQALDFPSGSMFWARCDALKPILDLDLTLDDFEAESGQTDGTLAHVLERLYAFACERAGYSWVKIANPDLYLDTSAIVTVQDQASVDVFVAQHTVSLLGRKRIPTLPEPPMPSDRISAGLFKAYERSRTAEASKRLAGDEVVRALASGARRQA